MSDRLFVAVDLNADSLRRTAWRASRRASRGGAPNLLCIAASPAELARDLPDVADRVSIILPWEELFRAIAGAERPTLQAVADLCQTEARFEFVFAYDPRRDASTGRLPSFYDAPATELQSRLQELYRRRALRVERVEELDQRALLEYPTTWAHRLAHGHPRKVWRIRGRKYK